MKLHLAISKVFKGFYSSIKRFPLTIFSSTIVAILLIIFNERLSYFDNDTLTKIIMTVALGIPIFLCIKLIFEKITSKPIWVHLISYLCGILFLIGYYFFFINDITFVTGTRYIGISLAIYFAFIYIPYFYKRDGFEMYVVSIVTNFFTTVLYSIILFLGLAAILFTTDKLLSFNVLSKTYYYAWLFVVFLFAVTYFLSNIPLKNDQIHSKSFPKLLKILLLYIVIPLLTVYTIILYIYFAKIILSKAWPIGLVSHLVLWYSIIIVFLLFFLTPIKNNINLNDLADFKSDSITKSDFYISKNFIKYAPKIVLPLILMMFFSIGIRVNAYGITENRYFIIILAVWIFCILIYFSFAKKVKNIILPITLSIIIIFSVLGPLSCYSISKNSQNNRLKNLLISNNILVSNIIKPNPNVSDAAKLEISSILSYFEFNHKLSDIKILPKDFKISDLQTLMGFSLKSTNGYSPMQSFHFTLNENYNTINVKDYDYFFISNFPHNKIANNNSLIDVTYNYNTSIVSIKYNGQELLEKNFYETATNLISKYTLNTANLIPINDMTYLKETDKYKIQIVVQNISGENSIEKPKIYNVEFYILIKIK